MLCWQSNVSCILIPFSKLAELQSLKLTPNQHFLFNHTVSLNKETKHCHLEIILSDRLQTGKQILPLPHTFIPDNLTLTYIYDTCTYKITYRSLHLEPPISHNSMDTDLHFVPKKNTTFCEHFYLPLRGYLAMPIHFSSLYLS